MNWDDALSFTDWKPLTFQVLTGLADPTITCRGELRKTFHRLDSALTKPSKGGGIVSSDGPFASDDAATVHADGSNGPRDLSGHRTWALPCGQPLCNNSTKALRLCVRDPLKLVEVPTKKKLELLSVDRLIQRLS